jgi:hypothetical protein
LHSSSKPGGHIYETDLVEFLRQVRPKQIIPIQVSGMCLQNRLLRARLVKTKSTNRSRAPPFTMLVGSVVTIVRSRQVLTRGVDQNGD